MSLFEKFSLLLYILSGFNWHVHPSQNKTFIFDSVNLFNFYYFLFQDYQ